MPQIIERIERCDCRSAVGRYGHCEGIEDDVLLAYTAPCRLFEDIFGYFYSAFGSGRYAPFVQRERDNRAAVLFYQGEHGVHHLFFAVHRIYERLAVVAPHSAFHSAYIGSINLQRQVGDRLNFAHGALQHGRFVDFGQADVYVEHVRAALRLGDGFAEYVGHIPLFKRRFKPLFARGVYSFAYYYGRFAEVHRVGIRGYDGEVLFGNFFWFGMCRNAR